MPLFLFLCHPCFLFGCSLLHLFFFPPPFSLCPHDLCALLSFHYSYLPPPPHHPILNCVWGFFSFLSAHPPTPSICPGAGVRRLLDCPQLLDVDDMVKMREPDWKCVYTYLQEFYRGLVTKGLVKTKNSS